MPRSRWSRYLRRPGLRSPRPWSRGVMPNRGEPLETCCATRLLRCAVLGILMYVYVHCGSCAPCALHLGRSLRFQEVPRSSDAVGNMRRSEEHTSELQSLMRISYAVFS